MDDFLYFFGLLRSDVAKDESCLYRVTSEQLFGTQMYHDHLKLLYCDYVSENKSLYESIFGQPVDVYIRKIKSTEVWPGEQELKILSFMFKTKFIIYKEDGKSIVIGEEDSVDKLSLCEYPYNRFDIVYNKKTVGILAVMQACLFEILYKRVFQLGDDVDIAVEKMLHDKDYAKQRRNQQISGEMLKVVSEMDENQSILLDGEEDPALIVRKALAEGTPPFPYKVAKSLDPTIYRNIEFDIWNEERKKKLEEFVTPPLTPGVKCIVSINENENYIGHVQEILGENKVNVYVEELCEKCTVDEGQVQVTPIPATQAMIFRAGSRFKYYGEKFSSFNAEFSRTEVEKRYKKKGFRRCFKDDFEKLSLDEANRSDANFYDSGYSSGKKSVHNRNYHGSPIKQRLNYDSGNSRGYRRSRYSSVNSESYVVSNASHGAIPKTVCSSKHSSPIPVPTSFCNDGGRSHSSFPMENVVQMTHRSQGENPVLVTSPEWHSAPVEYNQFQLIPMLNESDQNSSISTCSSSYPLSSTPVATPDTSVAPSDSYVTSANPAFYYYVQGATPVYYNYDPICATPSPEAVPVQSSFYATTPPPSGMTPSWIPYAQPSYGAPNYAASWPLTSLPICASPQTPVMSGIGAFQPQMTPPWTPSLAPSYPEVPSPGYVQQPFICSTFNNATVGSTAIAPTVFPLSPSPYGDYPM